MPCRAICEVKTYHETWMMVLMTFHPIDFIPLSDTPISLNKTKFWLWFEWVLLKLVVGRLKYGFKVMVCVFVFSLFCIGLKVEESYLCKTTTYIRCKDMSCQIGNVMVGI
ncbi:hypothetical protein CFP56_024344 [Quercus suber]|uniref:Uncharacterized protein n=1 Tax=Quercus suber TaxID=58331 RepID=A0AAW0MAZ2_QUESU